MGPVQRVRAGSAVIAGSVLGFFYLLPLLTKIIGPARETTWILPAALLIGAAASGVWAWYSAFGCRLIGVCTLLTAPLALFGLLLLPLVLESPPLALTVLLPVGLVAVGVLTIMAGSSDLDRVHGTAWRDRGRA